jgi:hypothetical protein
MLLAPWLEPVSCSTCRSISLNKVMASGALTSLISAVGEVSDLERIIPVPSRTLKRKTASYRVIGRASVVLLSSHFERYFYAINEEASSFINACGVSSNRLPERLRLVHSKLAIDNLQLAAWDRRTDGLTEFIEMESWLWINGSTGMLKANKLLGWMKSPMPDNLIRYYKDWGILDIFSAITRKPQTRSAFFLRVRELVEKRNNIAHGDFSAQATVLDVKRYSATVIGFCRRADRVFGKHLGTIAQSAPPW